MSDVVVLAQVFDFSRWDIHADIWVLFHTGNQIGTKFTVPLFAVYE